MGAPAGAALAVVERVHARAPARGIRIAHVDRPVAVEPEERGARPGASDPARERARGRGVRADQRVLVDVEVAGPGGGAEAPVRVVVLRRLGEAVVVAPRRAVGVGPVDERDRGQGAGRGHGGERLPEARRQRRRLGAAVVVQEHAIDPDEPEPAQPVGDPLDRVVLLDRGHLEGRRRRAVGRSRAHGELDGEPVREGEAELERLASAERARQREAVQRHPVATARAVRERRAGACADGPARAAVEPGERRLDRQHVPAEVRERRSHRLDRAAVRREEHVVEQRVALVVDVVGRRERRAARQVLARVEELARERAVRVERDGRRRDALEDHGARPARRRQRSWSSRARRRAPASAPP